MALHQQSAQTRDTGTRWDKQLNESGKMPF